MKFIGYVCLLLMSIQIVAGDLDPVVKHLVDKIDEKAASINTMKARFVQRKEMSLMKDPSVMEGDFYLDRKHGLALHFDPEEDLHLFLNEDKVVSISHGAKKATEVDVKQRQINLAQKILDDKLGKLLRYFDISRSEEPDAEGNRFIELIPSKRKTKKKFDHIRIWINSDFLIYQVKVQTRDGDLYELLLSDIQLNQELEDSLFDAKIPDDYEMDERMEKMMNILGQ